MLHPTKKKKIIINKKILFNKFLLIIYFLFIFSEITSIKYYMDNMIFGISYKIIF